jgi:23S rRNA U2552 (ribose-2'-O)-methylase RlmE/FtsJ
MNYFLLPNINHNIYKFIDCIFNEELTDKDKSSTLDDLDRNNSSAYYLNEIKNKIKIYEREWDIYKKFTNPYEFINTIIPNKNKCVSKYKPLSRSYFKMIELLHFFLYDELLCDSINLYSGFGCPRASNQERDIHHSGLMPRIEVKNTAQNPDLLSRITKEPKPPLVGSTVLRNPVKNIKTFHLAEGPGGFIEAISNLRNNSNDQYVGMTILCDINGTPHNVNKTVPGWKKSDHFLKTHPNVYIEIGEDKTGNILSLNNFMYCRTKYGSSMDFITGDGGFDFSSDFNNQEINISQLLFGQVCYAICLQKQGGTFILKVFDCFMEHTVDILFILSAFYKNVYITKPKTSRYANSEKYIVCKNFILSNDSAVFPYLTMAFQKMVNQSFSSVKYKSETTCSNDLDKCKKTIHRFIKIPIPSFFYYKIEEYNSIFCQQQIENIHQTIILIEQLQFAKEINTFDRRSTNNVNTRTAADGDTNNEDRIPELLEDFTSATAPIKLSTDEDCNKYENKKKIYKKLCNRSTTEFPEKIENLIRTNIRKCVQWCNYYNIYHNFSDDNNYY